MSHKGFRNVVMRNTERMHQRKKEQGIQREEEIFSIIAASEPDGKSSADLRKDTNLSRDRIHTICRKYMDLGLLFKTGRFGKYRLTEKALGDPGKRGFYFGSTAMKKFFSLDLICTNNKFCNSKYCELAISDKHYLKNTLGSDIRNEVDLFEFALRIGSVITYEMIEAMKYFGSEIIADKVDKDQLAWKWVDSVITPNRILKAFADTNVIGKRLNRNKNDSLTKWSFYEMDKEDLHELELEFKNVFPEVYVQLEDIMSKLPSKIDLTREYAKQILRREKQMKAEDPNHSKCGGKILPEVKVITLQKPVQQCSVCHRWIEIQKGKTKTIDQN
jgi:hypothetical protein